MNRNSREKGYKDFCKYQLTWSPYFHYGLFDGADYLEKAQEDAIDQFCALASIGALSRVLDVGCGIGSTALYIAAKHRCHVVGFDPVQEQIEYARQRVKRDRLEGLISLKVGAMESLPVTAKFDVVLINEVLCLVKDKGSALRHIDRILSDDGRVVISDLYDSSGGQGTAYFHRAMGHVTPMLGPEEFKRLITASGFQIGKIVDRKADVAKSYEAALVRLERNEARVVAECGRDEYDVVRAFYDYCLSDRVKTAIGWAIYCVRKSGHLERGH